MISGVYLPAMQAVDSRIRVVHMGYLRGETDDVIDVGFWS